MAVINGTDMHLFIENKHTGHAKSHSIEMSGSEIDISNKDTGGWDDFISGRKNWTAKADAIVDLSDDQGFEQAFDAWISDTPVTIASALKTGSAIDTSETHWTGTAIITSISLNAGDGEAVTYSISYKGKGALTKVSGV